MPTIEVRTLGQFLESDQVIDCDCSNYWVCSHSGELPLEHAIRRMGWDFDFYARRTELAAQVYCSGCGKSYPTFRLGWKARPGSYTGAHGAGTVVRSVLAAREILQDWKEPEDWTRGGKGVRKFGPRT